MTRKTALITGATSGIGAAFSRKYAALGYDLIITGRRIDKINQLAEEIRTKNKVQVEVVIAELSDQKDIKDLLETIKGRDIDVLVNNAGFGYKKLFQEGDLDIFQKMIEVHISAAIALTHQVLPDMVKKGSGSIINVSSESAFLLIPKNAIYTGTKAFLKSFTEALHFDLLGTGVKVLALCPGLVRSDFHEKMGMDKSRQHNKGIIKWMEADEVVKIALRDLEKGKVVCVPGMYEKFFIQLMNLIPGFVYKKLAWNFSNKKK